MTTLKRSLLAASLAAAGLLGANFAQAAEPDVSTIYGRGAPPNAHVTAHNSARAHGEDFWNRSTVSDRTARHEEPLRSSTENAAPESRGATTAGTTAAPEGEYITTPATARAAPDTIVTPTGSYLAVDEATAPDSREMAVVHEENIDGVPLVEGRGMRPGWNIYAGPVVTTEPAFDVADILGRSSPPAPENAPNYGMRS